MKTKICIYVLITCMLGISACKKNNSLIKQDNLAPSNSPYASAKLENGYLSFKDYPSFISAMKNIYSLKPIDRNTREKSFGFVSMKTIYNNFNNELDALEKLSREEYFRGFDLLKEKYKKEITFTENSYTLNCSGLAESYLANSDGIVKVGNDFLHFSLNNIETYSNTQYSQVLYEVKNKNLSNDLLSIKAVNQSGNPREKISFLNGSKPNTNSFSVNASSYSTVFGNNNRAEFFARAKIYNVHSSAFGYRGFATYECNAKHKNIFGTFRDANYLAGAYGQVEIILNSEREGYPFGFTTFITADIQTGTDSADEGTKEFVIAASNTLISNPSIVNQAYNYIQFGSGTIGVNDDVLQPNGYWNMIGSGAIPIQPKSFIQADILGDAIFSYPSVTFDPLNIVF